MDSKATTLNPKDLLGVQKVDITAIPTTAIIVEAASMMDGVKKYGHHNWRTKKVIARIYIAAALRHIFAWEEGEELAADSGVHHLGHARACLGILIDAQRTGNLVDDRPIVDGGQTAAKLLEELSERIKTRL